MEHLVDKNNTISIFKFRLSKASQIFQCDEIFFDDILLLIPLVTMFAQFSTTNINFYGTLQLQLRSQAIAASSKTSTQSINGLAS